MIFTIIYIQFYPTSYKSESVSHSHVQLFATPWTVACQAPLSMENSRAKNTGMGCHSLVQGIFPTQGIEPKSPALQAVLVTRETLSKGNYHLKA